MVASILTAHGGPSICNAQGSNLVRNLNVQILPEDGAPVVVNSLKAEADLDPFGAPIDVRIYADYKNVSDRPVSGVKFRLRYVDDEGKDRGTFHAPHLYNLGPGMTANEKWKREKVDPRVSGIMVRVLAVKFSDGTVWESSKAGNIVKPSGAGAPTQSNAPGGGPDAECEEPAGTSGGTQPQGEPAEGANPPPAGEP